MKEESRKYKRNERKRRTKQVKKQTKGNKKKADKTLAARDSRATSLLKTMASRELAAIKR